MKHLFLILMMMLLTTQAYASGKAQVLVLKGSATFGGFKLKQTSKMNGKGEIVVGDKSYLKIQLLESKTIIALAANTRSEINFSAPAEKQELNLIKGIARWVTGDKKGRGVKTPNASMGVRGTDFYVSYFPEKKETELMCFSGTVVMTNLADPKDHKIVKDSQWGGIGGSFGDKVTDIVTLTPDVLKKFDDAVPKK